MNIMRKHYKACCLFSILLVGAIFVGCSKDAETPPEVVEQSEPAPAVVFEDPVTVTDTIEYVLNEAMTRLHYKDKTGLYENEFEYYRVQNDFDKYLTTRQMEFAQADTLTNLEVIEAKLYEHDSASVDLYIHYEGPTGVHHQDRDTILVYYHNGRWIKPTVSKLKDQLEYEKAQGKGN